MKIISDEQKRQIRSLSQEKVRIEDLLQFETNKEKIKRYEDDLYEVKDTLDKLTNGFWFEDASEHELQKERQGVN